MNSKVSSFWWTSISAGMVRVASSMALDSERVMETFWPPLAEV